MSKPTKNNSANKKLNTRKDTEMTNNEFDLEISEAEKDKIVFEATREFLKSGIEIKDVFGNLED